MYDVVPETELQETAMEPDPQELALALSPPGVPGFVTAGVQLLEVWLQLPLVHL